MLFFSRLDYILPIHVHVFLFNLFLNLFRYKIWTNTNVIYIRNINLILYHFRKNLNIKVCSLVLTIFNYQSNLLSRLHFCHDFEYTRIKYSLYKKADLSFISLNVRQFLGSFLLFTSSPIFTANCSTKRCLCNSLWFYFWNTWVCYSLYFTHLWSTCKLLDIITIYNTIGMININILRLAGIDNIASFFNN